jgi:hypothetical protein
LTKTVAVTGVPSHPLAEAVIVKVTKTGVVRVFVRVPEIFPVPEEAIPVTVELLSLFQESVAPGKPLDGTIWAMGLPEQTVCDEGVAEADGK